MDDAGALPVVRLRPKANARRIRHGYPWIWADELVTDRRTKALAPGSLARLEDADRSFLGCVGVNTGSKIVARMLDRTPDAMIDEAWFARRLSEAARVRQALFDAPFWRWVHAEADRLPGVVIDRFGDTAVVQPNAAWADVRIEMLVDAITKAGVPNVVVNGSGRARLLEGLDGGVAIARGAVSGPIAVPMNGAIYMADVLAGQKTGLFYDQRPNHAFAAKYAPDQHVLDLFCHVGGFGLAALAAGAKSCLAVDASAFALELARLGAHEMAAAHRLETVCGDVFDVVSRLAG
ncbi:MAG: class I SAM-dependent methyltransferase, partial [Pseudomonadota bacterium]